MKLKVGDKVRVLISCSAKDIKKEISTVVTDTTDTTTDGAKKVCISWDESPYGKDYGKDWWVFTEEEESGPGGHILHKIDDSPGFKIGDKVRAIVHRSPSQEETIVTTITDHHSDREDVLVKWGDTEWWVSLDKDKKNFSNTGKVLYKIKEEEKKVKNKTPYQVGQSVTIKNIDSVGIPDSGLINKSGTYKIAGLDPTEPNRVLLCFGRESEKGGLGFGWSEESSIVKGFIDEDYKGSKNRFWWAHIDAIEANKAEGAGNDMKSNVSEDKGMIDNLKESGTKLGEAIQHGAAVGAATSGADYAYSVACSWLHTQFGIPLERLRDPMNREVITAASIALMHVGAGAAKAYNMPGMDKVQNGCLLVIEGKAKDNMGRLLEVAGPMLLKMSELMDPEKAMERITKQMKKGLEEQGFSNPPVRLKDVLPDEQEAEALEEAAALSEMLATG